MIRDHIRRAQGVLKRLRSLPGDVPSALRSWRFAAPGHFYSPIPSLKSVLADSQRLFDKAPRTLPGIPLHDDAQLRLLETFAALQADIPFGPERRPGLRYWFDNVPYTYSDGVILYSMLRHLRPRRVVEVGSGFSSALMLDVGERFLDGKVEHTFIEPYPALLESLITPADAGHVEIVPERVQDVPLSTFARLKGGDILFIDSSHVSKVGSDVNYLLSEVLPSLAAGVYIHIHDIFYPFEYPKSWIQEGRAWNEAYLVRAFLQFNDSFEMVFWNSFLERCYAERMARALPLGAGSMGASLWLRRTR